MHARSHSLSDPRAFVADARDASPVPSPLSASSSPSFDFYQTPSVSDWRRYAAGSVPQSAHPSPDPGTSVNVNACAQQPYVAFLAASPQSMVSSGSTHADPSAVSSPPADETASPSRSGNKKPSIDRNRKPCGACSGSKRKCKLIPDMPNLCERCRNHGLTECPPHISWSNRRANLHDSGSLSPLELDEREFSSRSVSPSCFGPGRSPVGYAEAYNQDEQGMYADMSTTREWVQTQSLGASGSSNAVDMSGHDQTYVPHNPNPNHLALQNQNLVVPHFVQQYAQNNPFLNPPALPVCHVCHTPYNEYLVLNYALAALSANMPCPPYDLDQTMLGAYGHIPPNAPSDNSPYENPNPY